MKSDHPFEVTLRRVAQFFPGSEGRTLVVERDGNKMSLRRRFAVPGTGFTGRLTIARRRHVLGGQDVSESEIVLVCKDRVERLGTLLSAEAEVARRMGRLGYTRLV